MLHIPPTNILISYSLKQTKKTRATQKSLPFRKWRLREKEVREWAKSRKGSDRKRNWTRQINKRRSRKVGSNW